MIGYLSENHPEASIVLVGHSMGGSIACKTVERVKDNEADYTFAKQIQGLFVIDVVEGTAMEALPFMESIVTSRPPAFKSLQSVVQYAMKSGTLRNLESARVSQPH